MTPTIRGTFPIPFFVAGGIGYEIIPAVPAAPVEIAVGTRKLVNLAYVEALSIHISDLQPGAADTKAAIQVSPLTGAGAGFWYGLDGTLNGRHELDLTTASVDGVTASTPEIISALLRQRCLMRRLTVDGDDATEVKWGDFIVWAETSSIVLGTGGAGGGSALITPACGLSATVIQGDDFNGGNPPLPNYADGAAPDTTPGPFTAIEILSDWWAVDRMAYGNSTLYGTPGYDMDFDTAVLFNGKRTLRGLYGDATPDKFGCGWWTDLSDDEAPGDAYGSPSEVATSPASLWYRASFAIESGFSTGAASTFQSGLQIVDISGPDTVALYVRQGRLYLDKSNSGVGGNSSTDLGPASLVVGAGFVDVIVRAWRIDGTTRGIRVWCGPACGGSSALTLLVDTTVITNAGNFQSIDKFNWTFDVTANATPKALWVGRWEWETDTGSNNPYGVP